MISAKFRNTANANVIYLIVFFLIAANLSCRDSEVPIKNTIAVLPQVEPAFLQIISPRYAEVWNYNTLREIQWTISARAHTLAIDLYRKHTHKFVIVSETENDGSYLWEVPSHLPSSNLYRIKLTNLQNSIDTAFSPYFSIR
jgi:hypothetical protein